MTTTYTYDAVNRLTLKSYSDGVTLPAQFGYDQTTLTIGGQQETPTNTIGRLSSDCILYSNSCGGGTMTGKSYDPMGRFALIWQEPPGTSYLEHFAYTYDLNGNETYRALSSMTFSATFSGASRMLSFTATDYTNSNNPANLLSGMHYNAAGQLTSDALADGEAETYTYDTRLRSQSMSSAVNSTPKYSYGLTFAPNSNITAANDSVNGNWNYSYDQFNRLVCASVSSNTACTFPPTGTPTYTYVYDRFGNRWQQNGSNSMQLSFTGNATTNNNRMDGYCYDSAGNLLDAGACPQNGNPHQYVYDAENRLISSNYSASTYTYNAEGERITKTTGGVTMTYTYDRDGHLFETYGQTNSLMENYVGGRHLGSYDWNSNDTGTVYHYTHVDWLGTERARTEYISGGWNLCETITSLPFGDGMTMSGSCTDTSNMHFTGKERDSESGLDNFGARYNASNFGRFMSPDWSQSPEPVPYAHESNPQSLNLYAYVGNNPINRTDPDGHRHEQCKSSSTNHTGNDGIIHVEVAVHCTMVADWWDFYPALLAAVGHHINPQAVFRQLPLSPAARQFFQKQFVTGRLLSKHYYDAAHRLYNRAAQRVVSRFMTERAAAGREGQLGLDEAKELGEDLVNDREIGDYLQNLETSSGRNGREVAEDILEGDADSAEVTELLAEIAAEAGPVIEAGVEATLEGVVESGVVPPIIP